MASRTYMEHLDVAHRAALRTIQSLLPSTDPTSVYLETNSIPLSLTGRIRALLQREKHIRMFPDWFKKPAPLQPLTQNNVKVNPPPRVTVARTSEVIVAGSSKNFYNRGERLIYSRYPPYVRSHGITFGCSLPKVSLEGSKEEVDKRKLAVVLEAVKDFQQYITAMTDGSVDGAISTAASIMHVGNTSAPKHLRGHLTDCGDCANSYTTELTAIRDLLLRLILPYILGLTDWPPKHKRIIRVFTDSKSALDCLSRGPNFARSDMENEIWYLLTHLLKMGWKTHLQFVYAHCGFLQNEMADVFSTSRADESYKTDVRVNGIETKVSPHVEPVREGDAAALLKRQFKRIWKLTLPTTSDRYKLMQHRPTPLINYCPITKLPLNRGHHSQLSRFRTGHSEIFGSAYFSVRGQDNVCRLCSAQSQPDPNGAAFPCPHEGCTAPAFTSQQDLAMHIARQHTDAPGVRRLANAIKKKTERDNVVALGCPRCPSILGNQTRLALHMRSHGDDESLHRTYTTDNIKNLEEMKLTCTEANCDFSTAIASEMTQHLKRLHPDSDAAKKLLVYPCRYKACEQMFVSAQSRCKHEAHCPVGDYVAHRFARGVDYVEGEEIPKRPNAKRIMSKSRKNTDSTDNEDNVIDDNNNNDNNANGKPPSETIPHLLRCSGCAQIRNEFCIPELHAKFGWKLFISLPFYAWVSSMFDPVSVSH